MNQISLRLSLVYILIPTWDGLAIAQPWGLHLVIHNLLHKITFENDCKVCVIIIGSIIFDK